MGRVVHFDINSEEPKKTIDFYKKIFDWKFTKWEGPMDYWLITTGEKTDQGIDGGLSKKGETAPPKCPTIDVNDLDKTMTMIEEHGGKLTSPKMPVPGVGWLTYFKDPDGNMFGAMQEDTTAK